MITPSDPACRTLPVDLPAVVVQGIVSGRIRTLHMTGPRAAQLGPGDCLWAREMFRLFPAGPGLVDVAYGQDRRRGLRWPESAPRLPAGVHLPEAMPPHLSRLTLVVTGARSLRLHEVTEDAAIAAGAIINRTGFGHPWAPDGEWPGAVETYGRMWDIWHGAAGREGWAVNPEVREIEYRAVMRNIAEMVPPLRLLTPGAGGGRG